MFPNINFRKSVLCFAKAAGLLLCVGWGIQNQYFPADTTGILFESRESKTTKSKPVFNKIKFFTHKTHDIWMMNQSHHGLNTNADNWDRLAIVVDKTRSPKMARYYQLQPGPLNPEQKWIEQPFKVSCFMCHNNGPRAVRPQHDSTSKKISLMDRLEIAYWNLKIISYGRVIPDPVHADSPNFQLKSHYENEPLKVSACVRCHQEQGLFARGELRRQQIPTIRFMLNQGLMPPPGFKLSNQDRQNIDQFIEGFGNSD
jgi:hypothetical protein